MKKLCLFRHAKSTYGSLGTDDLDRPLHDVGSINAPMMADVLLNQHQFKADLIVSSHAKRALETAKLISEKLKLDENNILINENLYEAGVEDILNEIQLFDKKYETILLVGHNPGLTLLANFLTNEHINNLVTCGMVGIEFETNEWKNLAEADNKILFIDDPKNHQ